jgi:hypothetical protein
MLAVPEKLAVVIAPTRRIPAPIGKVGHKQWKLYSAGETSSGQVISASPASKVDVERPSSSIWVKAQIRHLTISLQNSNVGSILTSNQFSLPRKLQS